MNVSDTVTFSDFVVQHIFWFVAFLILFVAYCSVELQIMDQEKFKLNVKDTVKFINSSNCSIIDLRDTNAYTTAHIIKSRSFSEDLLFKSLNKQFRDKKGHILLVCNKGISAVSVFNKLNKKGYENVKVLAGGMQAWNKAHMPVQSGKDSGISVGALSAVNAAKKNKKNKKTKNNNLKN